MRRKVGRMLEKDRLNLEESLEYYRKKEADLQDMYDDQMKRYEKALEHGDAENAALLLKMAESTQKMHNQAMTQYTEVYDKIASNSEISERDGRKKNANISTAVGVGTAIGSLTLGALSLAQAVETDKQGLFTNKNVKHFFESINPMRILRDKH